MAEILYVSRSRRLIPKFSVQHIIARFVDARFVFDLPGAREFYLARLGVALATHDARVFCYSLMSSHLHLGVYVGRARLSRIISSAHTTFALWVNQHLSRIGAVFAGRYKSISFEKEDAGKLLAYIHNNSTRAGVVESPADCPWSSHRAYLGDRHPPKWLDLACGLELSGFGLDGRGRRGLADFVEERKHDPRDPVLVGETKGPGRPPAIRGATMLMSPRLERSSILSWPLSTAPTGPHGPAWQGQPTDAVDTAAAVLGVPAGLLRSRARDRRVSAARDALLLAWADHLGRATHEMAAVLGISASAASHATRRARGRADRIAEAIRIAANCGGGGRLALASGTPTG